MHFLRSQTCNNRSKKELFSINIFTEEVNKTALSPKE